MASRCIEMVLAAILVAMMWGGAVAQLSCSTAIISLSPCIGYVTGNSSTPSPTCCSQLASVVSSQPQCLCTLLNGGSSLQLGFNLNQTQALNLPGACSVQTPPVSQCKAAAGPVAAPATAPAEAPTAAATSPSEPPKASEPATPSAPSVPSAKPLPPTVPSPTQPSAPSVPSPTQPSAPSVPKNASKTVPSPSRNTSAAASTALPLSVLVVLFFASFASHVAVF